MYGIFFVELSEFIAFPVVESQFSGGISFITHVSFLSSDGVVPAFLFAIDSGNE